MESGLAAPAGLAAALHRLVTPPAVATVWTVLAPGGVDCLREEESRECRLAAELSKMAPSGVQLHRYDPVPTEPAVPGDAAAARYTSCVLPAGRREDLAGIRTLPTLLEEPGSPSGRVGRGRDGRHCPPSAAGPSTPLPGPSFQGALACPRPSDAPQCQPDPPTSTARPLPAALECLTLLPEAAGPAAAASPRKRSRAFDSPRARSPAVGVPELEHLVAAGLAASFADEEELARILRRSPRGGACWAAAPAASCAAGGATPSTAMAGLRLRPRSPGERAACWAALEEGLGESPAATPARLPDLCEPSPDPSPEPALSPGPSPPACRPPDRPADGLLPPSPAPCALPATAAPPCGALRPGRRRVGRPAGAFIAGPRPPRGPVATADCRASAFSAPAPAAVA